MEKVKVMIVDDSKVSRVMLANNLVRTNFEVVAQAKDAAEALKLYEEYNPDLVTMDMNLPDADGIECSRRICAVDPGAKIVMISAMKDANLIEQGKSAGISAFLQKPVSANDLIDTLLLLCQEKISRIALLRESYAKPFAVALKQGILDLINLKVETKVELYEKKYLEVNGIAIIIGLTGTPSGRAIVYMSDETMENFAKRMLGGELDDEDDAQEAAEEASNIFIGRGVSAINGIFKDKEMRITPPGTFYGSGVKMTTQKLVTFKITALSELGEISINVGFAEGD
ncbi:MAG: response regulator [Selenomonadaceae bacterium]|nr:response regulator [Selenomonadaceae bacterium]